MNKDKEGFVVWLTGLPGSGKSTIGRALKRRLSRVGCEAELLDGDELRSHPGFDTGFDPASRVEHLERVAYICGLLASHGVNVVASFVSPYRRMRSFARKEVKKFVEVYVSCPLEVCKKRDPKGLYRKAAQGRVSNMTGVGDVYEEPLHPEIVIDTSVMDAGSSVNRIFNWLVARGFVAFETGKRDCFRHDILMVRHGMSSWNEEGRMRGRSDIGLNDTGFAQAEQLSRILSETPISAVYSSPLKRAVQTAQVIASTHGLEVNLLAGLTGVDVGSWEGKMAEEMLARVGDPYQRQRYDRGETFAHLLSRMGRTVEMVKRECEGNVLLVSHGDPIAAALCHLLGLDHTKMGAFYPRPASITKVSFETGAPRIGLFNYVPCSVPLI